MAEWFKAAVLKTADRKVRGFESYSLRHFWVCPGALARSRRLFLEVRKSGLGSSAAALPPTASPWTPGNPCRGLAEVARGTGLRL